jgi:CRISPR-associated endonuclease Cas1
MTDVGRHWAGVMTPRNGLVVLSGYGLRVAVGRKHLLVEDGICDERRTRRLAKAPAGIRRLVVLGHTGFITLEALRWLHDVGAAFMQIDADGQVIVASGPMRLDDARLRRAQALAPTNGVGTGLARELVRRKLEGQLALLDRLHNGRASAPVIQNSLANLDGATTPAQLRLYESAAAKASWKAWESVPVRFVRKDEPRIPEHWRTFGRRTSPLTGSPRLATNPTNAILNYVYAIAETETQIAAQALGLDPGMGVLHADQPSRDSLALDLMEPVRPEVDACVLELLQRQVFRAADFFETREGVCRVLPPLTQALVETASQWRIKVGPVAERAAQIFASGATARMKQLPTPLSQSRRSAGRAQSRKRTPNRTKSQRPTMPNACLACGTVLETRGRSYCNECLPEQRAMNISALQVAGPATLARLMVEGRDPTHGGAAARSRAASLARHRKEAAEWERTNRRPDPGEFTRNILPGLQGVPIEKIARATGLSIRYCSFIRRGLNVPHPRHWETMKGIVPGQ